MRPILGARWLVGLLLGLSVGTVGLKAGLGPIKTSSIFAIMAILLAIAFSGRTAILTYRPSKVELASAAFIVVAIVCELINAIQLNHPPRFDVPIQWLSYTVAFTGARLVIGNDEDRLQLLQGFLFFAPIFASIGLLQALNMTPVVQVVLDLTQSTSAMGRFERDEFTRATGLVGHWTGFGAYLLAMTAALLSENILRRRNGVREGSTFALRLALLGLGIIGTVTLSVILAYFFVVVIYLWKLRKIGTFGGLIVLAAGVASSALSDLLQRRLDDQFGYNPGALAEMNGILPETLAYRLTIWTTQTIPAILERPLSGWGQGLYIEFGRWLDFPSYLTWRSAESQWLLTMVTSGTAVTALLLVVVYHISSAFRAQKGALRSILVAFIVACFLVSFTVPIFTNNGLPAALMVISAIFVDTQVPGRRQEQKLDLGCE